MPRIAQLRRVITSIACPPSPVAARSLLSLPPSAASDSSPPAAVRAPADVLSRSAALPPLAPGDSPRLPPAELLARASLVDRFRLLLRRRAPPPAPVVESIESGPPERGCDGSEDAEQRIDV